MNDCDRLKLFEDLSRIFQIIYYKPLWRKYDLNDPINAASLFLEGYAFERQGRSPAFSPAAVEAINRSRKEKDSVNFPLIVWNNFRDLLNGEGLNRKLNPLYPKYPQYHLEKSCGCIWCTFNSENIINSSKQALETGKTKDAWERLKKIQGVGPKIASLFLRDVATWYDLALPKDDNRWYLQPIDIWVRRIVINLNKKYMNDEEVARWIVINSDKPEQCNQGIWYFGAKIAQAEFRLESCLKDPEKTIEQHIIALKANAQAIFQL